MLNSSTFSFRKNRTIAYFLVILVVWLVYICGASWIADTLAVRHGEKIISAAKHRIVNPAHFVEHRILDFAYLTTVLVCLVAVLDWLLVGRFQKWGAWRFVPMTIVSFVAANVAVVFASKAALLWVVLYASSPNMRLANHEMSQKILWESTETRTSGVLLGSSQMNAQVSVVHLNQLLGGEALFADLSYYGGFPHTVLMVQDRLEQKPDLAIWYMSSLCINDHLEFGAAAQSLMTGRVEDDFDALDGTKAFGWLRMFYGRVGRWLPLFRIRREAEGLLFAITGTPEVAHPNRTEDPAEMKAKTLDRFIEVMTKGDGTEAQFEHARQFRLECLNLVVDRFHEMGTKLVIIIGHVHPDVEELYPQMRAELLQHVLEAAEGKPMIHVVDEELPECPAEQFRDLAHLGEDHRNAYTEAVFEHLKKTGMVGQATDTSNRQ